MKLEDYKSLYDKYNRELRPLSAEIEGRLDMFEEPILKDIYGMLSFIVDNKYIEAEQQMNLSIRHAYEYLLYALLNTTNQIQERYSVDDLESIDGGKFIKDFKENKITAEKSISKALASDDIVDAISSYRIAYVLLTKNEKSVLHALSTSSLIFSTKKEKKFLHAFEICALIIISVVVGCLAKYFTAIV